MSIVSRLKKKGPNGLGYGSTAAEVVAKLDLAGRTILVTGCRSGLGLATGRALAAGGARLVGTARTAELARSVLADLDTRAGGPPHVPVACDLADVASVRACVATVTREVGELDAVICNAGIMALPRLEQAYGYELQFFTNHVGHFILVTGLLDRVARDGRIVVVSSEAHRRAPPAGIELDNLSGAKRYAPWTAYGQSKLANLLFSNHLALRLAGGVGKPGTTSNALHPGVIQTALSRHIPGIAQLALRLAAPFVLKSKEEGAATQTYLATRPEVALTSGKYFKDCQPAAPSVLGRDAELAARLWNETERIVARL
jgi:NAD(P)-dependent dehydrogenase (short-subunit alcohol dehydrogenase family)